MELSEECYAVGPFAELDPSPRQRKYCSSNLFVISVTSKSFSNCNWLHVSARLVCQGIPLRKKRRQYVLRIVTFGQCSYGTVPLRRWKHVIITWAFSILWVEVKHWCAIEFWEYRNNNVENKIQPSTNMNSNFVAELNNKFFVIIYISDGGDNLMYPQRNIFFKI